jgi:hypothetical protein
VLPDDIVDHVTRTRIEKPKYAGVWLEFFETLQLSKVTIKVLYNSRVMDKNCIFNLTLPTNIPENEVKAFVEDVSTSNNYTSTHLKTIHQMDMDCFVFQVLSQ